jgi:hypothetical protein
MHRGRIAEKQNRLGFRMTLRFSMNAGLGRFAAARFFGVVIAFCLSGELTSKGQAVLRESTSVSPFSYEAGGEAAYVGTGGAKRGSRSVGDITEISSSAGIVMSTQVSRSALLRLGVQWQRYSFDPDPNAPIPDSFQGLNLVVGADFQVSPAVILRIDALPGVYGSFRDVSFKDFNVPFQIGGSYFVSTDLVFIAGIAVDVNSDFPVYPAIGLHWKIGSKWVIEGVPPRPQLQYLLSDNVTLFADNAILQYREVRASAGLTWKLSKNVSVDIEGGCVPYRRFYYPRADDFKVLSEDVVPYGRIGITAKF